MVVVETFEMQLRPWTIKLKLSWLSESSVLWNHDQVEEEGDSGPFRCKNFIIHISCISVAGSGNCRWWFEKSAAASFCNGIVTY